jgi:hypothetical protein
MCDVLLSGQTNSVDPPTNIYICVSYQSPGLLTSEVPNFAYVEIVELFKMLMAKGLDPMVEDARQRTSLDVAAAFGSEHNLKLFERKPME